MNKHRFLTGKVARILGGFVVLAACLPLGAVAADRVVLGEEFTATW